MGRMLTNQETDAAIHKIAEGDIAALHAVYESYRQAVLLLAYSLTKSKPLAEDVMQDTFLVVYDKAATYRTVGKGKAWILGIARYVALQHLEKQQRSIPCDAPREQEIDAMPRFEDVVEQNQHVKQMLSILRGKEQDIVVLHTLADVKLKDIAGLLGMPLGTVYWSYSNALRKLKRYLLTQQAQEAADEMTASKQ